MLADSFTTLHSAWLGSKWLYWVCAMVLPTECGIQVGVRKHTYIEPSMCILYWFSNIKWVAYQQNKIELIYICVYIYLYTHMYVYFLIVGLPIGRKKIMKGKNSVDVIGENFT